MDNKDDRLLVIKRRARLKEFSKLLDNSESIKLILNNSDVLSTANSKYYKTFNYDFSPTETFSRESSIESLQEWVISWIYKIIDTSSNTYHLHLEDFGELDWVQLEIYKPSKWLQSLWHQLTNHSFCLVNTRTKQLVVISEEEHSFSIFYIEM